MLALHDVRAVALRYTAVASPASIGLGPSEQQKMYNRCSTLKRPYLTRYWTKLSDSKTDQKRIKQAIYILNNFVALQYSHAQERAPSSSLIHSWCARLYLYNNICALVKLRSGSQVDS